MNERLAEQFEGVVKQNQALDAKLKAVADQNKALANKLDALTKPKSTATSGGGTSPTAGAGNGAGDGNGTADSPPDLADDNQPEDIRTDQPEPKPKQKPTPSFFQDGFKWETRDGEYTLNFHNETQLDIRAYEQRASDPVNQTGFYVPRMRLFFNGRMSKPIEYSVSINKGLGSLDLLDAYLNFNYDKRFQVRVGRFRVPFTYDWYSISNTFLTTPERSLWAINYGYNRNFAVMGHGEILDDSAEYAVAAVNGPRNSYFDANSHKDVLAYLNARPFMHSERLPFLKFLNVGGSMAYGIEDQTPLPIDFRTSANATESAGTVGAAPSFLQLNQGVVERGRRELWELHAAYFYKGLSLWGAWDSGFNSYARGDRPYSVRVPTSGFHVATGYFLTGEHVERRTFVEPLHPFDLRAGKFGLGAVELQARYSEFNLGNDVFTAGLADPNLWTNHVYAVDSGLNWYLNRYVKIYLDWQHSVFGQPVPYRPGGLQKTSDLFWLRLQLYY